MDCHLKLRSNKLRITSFYCLQTMFTTFVYSKLFIKIYAVSSLITNHFMQSNQYFSSTPIYWGEFSFCCIVIKFRISNFAYNRPNAHLIAVANYVSNLRKCKISRMETKLGLDECFDVLTIIESNNYIKIECLSIHVQNTNNLHSSNPDVFLCGHMQ